MRFAATLLVLVAIALVARADGPAPAKRTQPVGFDHAAHGQKAPGIDCAKCHVLAGGLATKPPGHASCFAAACHTGGTKLDKLDADRVKLCITCHAETALVLPADAKALAATKVTTGVEHGVQFGHNSHPKPQCATCHDVRAGAKPQRRPHDRCIACHGEKAADKTFAIGACEKCHPRGTERPRFTDNQIVVTTAFSHAKHATRGAAKCATCHASLAASDARQLPRPGLATCTTEGCHDGKAAFNSDASCTKCHKDAPKTTFKVARPGEAFSHEKHEPRGALPCASCHPLNKSGEVLVASHAACANGKCHPNEMGQRNPKICNACHDGTEPWRLLKADKLPAESTEFGATLDHQKHGSTPCAGCHSLTTTRTELRAPRGHRACTTSGCHATTGGPAPQITACESCHIKNLDETRRATRFGATWSVRQMFVHGTHTSKAGEIACVKCHDDLKSPTVLSLAAPAKKSCATEKCHDGTGGTFKVTGTSCTKCHRGAAK